MDVSSSLPELWHYMHGQNQEKMTFVVEYWRFYETIWDIFGIHKHYILRGQTDAEPIINSQNYITKKWKREKTIENQDIRKDTKFAVWFYYVASHVTLDFTVSKSCLYTFQIE
jgi:hypothetical protein